MTDATLRLKAERLRRLNTLYDLARTDPRRSERKTLEFEVALALDGRPAPLAIPGGRVHAERGRLLWEFAEEIHP